MSPLSPDEDVFLAEIAAAPRSVDRRLIYADWLEERSDPRADLIRTWHDMDSVDAWNEQFGELLQHVRSLFEVTSQEWRKQLGYDVLQRPMFSEIPQDRPSRWRLLSHFLDLWFQPIVENDRVSASVLQSTELRLGCALPAALKEWYRHSGYAQVWGLWTELTEPADLYLDRRDGDLRLCGTQATRYFIKPSDLGMDDPPVYFESRGNTVAIGQSVSKFAMYCALQTLTRASTLWPGWRAGRFLAPDSYVPDDLVPVAMFSQMPDGSLSMFAEGRGLITETCSNELHVTAIDDTLARPMIDLIPSHQVQRRENGEWQEPVDERRFLPGFSDAETRWA